MYTTLLDCENFLKTRHWTRGDDPVLLAFEHQVHLLNLLPKTLVEYHREGYQTKDGSGTRIIFDHRIKRSHSRNLFHENANWFRHHEQMIDLEVKHTNSLPGWINQIVKCHGLRLVSNSKFALGIQASQQDLIFPGWSDI